MIYTLDKIIDIIKCVTRMVSVKIIHSTANNQEAIHCMIFTVSINDPVIDPVFTHIKASIQGSNHLNCTSSQATITH